MLVTRCLLLSTLIHCTCDNSTSSSGAVRPPHSMSDSEQPQLPVDQAAQELQKQTNEEPIDTSEPTEPEPPTQNGDVPQNPEANGVAEPEAAPENPEPSADDTPSDPPKPKPAASVNLDPEFPTTLEGFGYEFNKEGVLTEVDTGEGFTFAVRKNHAYNQRRYEALGEVITEYVYAQLESRCGLQRIYLPVDAKETDARSFVFASPDLATNEECLLVLIHGSGVVRAGQWARSIIINRSLHQGSQIPYVERARANGWAVLLLNTNLNMALSTDEDGGSRHMDYIQGSGTPEEHVETVWEQFVSPSKARDIFIVAHSFGGVVTAHMADKRPEEFTARVTRVALTDSVHSLAYQDCSSDVKDYFERNVVNWVSAPLPLDKEIDQKHNRKPDCKLRSAGTTKHEMTSHCAKDSIFSWFSSVLEDDGREESSYNRADTS